MTKRTRIGPRAVVTFSSLLAMAQRVKVTDQKCYRDLTGWCGSVAFLQDCTVKAVIHSDTKLICRFEIKGPDGDYCYITARAIDGHCYSLYEARFMNSHYNKRVQRHLPFDLPAKLRMHDYCPMVLFNVDGSVAYDLRKGWSTYGRGRVATPMQKICIRDTDGVMVGPKMEKVYQEFCNGHGIADPVQVMLGNLEDTCQPREWFDSMVGPHWDSNRVRLLAIRAYKEALRVVAAHPHIKIALYAMDQRPVGATYRPSRLCIEYPSAHVLERDKDLEPLMYFLPCLCLYWTEKPTYYNNVKCIYVTIPPHGCRLLELDREIPAKANQIRHGLRTLDTSLKEQIERGNVLERVAYTFGKTTKLDGVKINWAAHPELVRSWEFGGAGKAVKPEDAFNSIEEKALMSSLPLC